MKTRPITVITPTRDRIAGFKLCRRWIARQTCRPDIDWIVVDDGDVPVGENEAEYRYYRRKPPEQKYTNFDNVLLGLQHSKGEVVMYIEDDDWISPHYVKNMVDNVNGYAAAALGGDLVYHIGYRRYIDQRIPAAEAKARRRFMGSFCTAGEGIEVLREACRAASKAEDPLIDLRFWKIIISRKLPFNVFASLDIVKIKGIPGRSITWKHRADVGTHDPEEKYLRSLIGNADTDAIVKASEGWENWIERWTNENLRKPKSRVQKSL